MSTLKERLREDLTVAMRARDDLRLSTLRLALSAVKDAEVAGTTARELDDPEVEKILAREVRKRREAAEAFAAAGRPEQSGRENAEGDVLAGYLPSQLGEDELRTIVDEVMAELGLTGMKAMGQVMKATQARVAGRADGKRVSELVRARLSET
ncbi:GatB/YqeY domain-containing protein [Parafrankia discariae]|uniref:GatB/YqeY domain-containing protein n=1 Tax=Parafrankia discariae TaxID=365528 RepID=UPI00036CC2F8|nr:GatB/YqeY domain-containing protein [Parafrankia discariae]